MQNEKPFALTKGSNKNLTNYTNIVRNLTTTEQKTQPNSRRELLDSTRLSRMPERESFNLPDIPFQKAAVVVCVGCGGRLETDNEFQQSIRACRKCLAHYAKIEAAIDESAKRKKRELLEKFAAEVKR